MSKIDRKLKVGILGATGAVGQRFIQLLAEHPQMYVHCLGASSKSAGSPYRKACQKWLLDTPMPQCVAEMTVQLCEPRYFTDCQLIFSALDSSVAGPIETTFRQAEFQVFSNASNHRMAADVPLVVPLVNSHHLEAIKEQRRVAGSPKGCLVANANCSTTGLVVALKPLHDAFEIIECSVTTMQAISGAGYPGVASLDILGNVVPLISGEEEKMELEPLKILGGWTAASGFQPATSIRIEASCNRVPVIDGHTMCVSLRFKRPPACVEEAAKVLASFKPEACLLKLHSAPSQAINLCDPQTDPFRPQPRLDVMAGGGYAVSVGRLRMGRSITHLQFTLLVHNTILGAAGSSIMNAELAINKGLL